MEQDKWVSTEPQVWKEEQEGDAIEGKLVEKRENGGKYGNASYLIENDEGVHVIFGTTVLESRMRAAEIGDMIRIVFKGIEKNKRNEDIKIFEVFKKKPLANEEPIREECVEGG
jgi:hypothetical protein